MRNKIKLINNLIQVKICLWLYFIPMVAFADDTKRTFGQFLVNLNRSLPDIFSFLSGLTTVAGVMFIIIAFFKLKHLADFRNMMSGQQELGKIFMLIVVGVAFLWMPFIIDAFTYTIFRKDGSVLDYPVAGGSMSSFEIAFYNLAKLVGLISFIKGWFILAGMAKGQAQPGTIGKAVTHMVSGILLFHLSATIKIIESTIWVHNSAAGG